MIAREGTADKESSEVAREYAGDNVTGDDGSAEVIDDASDDIPVDANSDDDGDDESTEALDENATLLLMDAVDDDDDIAVLL